jgi:L-ascorbate metabolism protein UlaG (beta-lactamase superfamily)
MLRCLAVFTVCLLLVPAAWSQGDKQPPKDKDKQKEKEKEKVMLPTKPLISWHGQSYFSLRTTKGTLLVFDPHAITQYGRPEQSLLPDVILMSHNHNDHTAKGIFDNVNSKDKDKAPVIIQGVVQGEDNRETWNIFENKVVKDLKITSVGAYHDEQQGMKHGKTAIFIVEVDGWRICHLGDLGHQVSAKLQKAIGEVDVLMIPCGGMYSLNGNEARGVLDKLKPKQYVLPMHIGTKVYDELLPVDEFIDDSPYPCAIVREGKLVYSLRAHDNVAWLKENSRDSDNTLVLDRHAQKMPVIVNLHYWPQTVKKKAVEKTK